MIKIFGESYFKQKREKFVRKTSFYRRKLEKDVEVTTESNSVPNRAPKCLHSLKKYLENSINDVSCSAKIFLSYDNYQIEYECNPYECFNNCTILDLN